MSSTNPKDPFTLIQNGQLHCATNDLWSAADNFGQAALILRDLSLTEIQNSYSQELTEKQQYKRRQFAQIYFENWKEYLSKARDCLIQILVEENSRDISSLARIKHDSQTTVATVSESDLSPPVTEGESERRTLIFQRLFALTASVPNDRIVTDEALSTGIELKEKEYEVRQLTVEERLAALNASLAPPTVEEKQNDLMDRLKRLGIHVPDNNPRGEEVRVAVGVLSEEEQVGEVLSLARDEVNMAKGGKRCDGIGVVNECVSDDDYDILNDAYDEESDKVHESNEIPVAQVVAAATIDVNENDRGDDISKENQVDHLVAAMTKEVKEESIKDEVISPDAASTHNAEKDALTEETTDETSQKLPPTTNDIPEATKIDEMIASADELIVAAAFVDANSKASIPPMATAPPLATSAKSNPPPENPDISLLANATKDDDPCKLVLKTQVHLEEAMDYLEDFDGDGDEERKKGKRALIDAKAYLEEAIRLLDDGS